ncbi:hypothetical protein L6452_38916 [Arctium lappa]|uniref:Uncharacterized protein n=1 Tax=Arctium lappa TaxID=4217 RepID=A0ACB8XQV5_ARCLA|nr:hypothetical protein L6452_38916 [Arctium lappa]
MGVPTGAFTVEFDTQMDDEFENLNGNHVGLVADCWSAEEVTISSMASGRLLECVPSGGSPDMEDNVFFPVNKRRRLKREGEVVTGDGRLEMASDVFGDASSWGLHRRKKGGQ